MMDSPERNAPLPADTLELMQALMHGITATSSVVSDAEAAAAAHNPLYTGPTAQPSHVDGTVKDVKETSLSLPGADGASFLFTEHAAGRYVAGAQEQHAMQPRVNAATQSSRVHNFVCTVHVTRCSDRVYARVVLATVACGYAYSLQRPCLSICACSTINIATILFLMVLFWVCEVLFLLF